VAPGVNSRNAPNGGETIEGGNRKAASIRGMSENAVHDTLAYRAGPRSIDYRSTRNRQGLADLACNGEFLDRSLYWISTHGLGPATHSLARSATSKISGTSLYIRDTPGSSTLRIDVYTNSSLSPISSTISFNCYYFTPLQTIMGLNIDATKLIC
jgi:hypothetical protein